MAELIPVGSTEAAHSQDISEQIEDATVRANISENTLQVIGLGIDFPLQFTENRRINTVKQSSLEERINDSIHLILSTIPGERPFNPEFGSRLPELVFEPNDKILYNLLRTSTAEALRRWEKRIEILQVKAIDNIDDDLNRIGIHIQYLIRNSHVRGSYVYPFVREGMPTSNLYTAQRPVPGNYSVR